MFKLWLTLAVFKVQRDRNIAYCR